MPIEFQKEATARFSETIGHILANEDYVHCPDCDAAGQIYAYADRDDPESGRYYNCPMCHGTKEADRDAAIELIRAWEASQGIDLPEAAHAG